MLKEFKDFAMKGNVIDMAVGVVIGGAFGKIVSSLVDDMIMPIISLLIGKVDFSNLFISLNGQHYATLKEAEEAGAAILKYGVFINTIVQFLIISFSIFLVIKLLSKMKKQEEPAPVEVTTKKCPMCMSEIDINAKRCPHCTSELE